MAKHPLDDGGGQDIGVAIQPGAGLVGVGAQPGARLGNRRFRLLAGLGQQCGAPIEGLARRASSICR